MLLLSLNENGIYCEKGDFYIDPWQNVENAIITHAHADHSRAGMKYYLAHAHSIPIMRHRLGNDIKVRGVKYGEKIHKNGVEISLHPAGHIIGSSQIRVAYKGEIWVVSGDFNTQKQKGIQAFEAIKCHHFISESTFGLPVFRWDDETIVFDAINRWWLQNAREGKVSILFCYALGKAQRVLQGIDSKIGKIFCHGAVQISNEILRNACGLLLPNTERVAVNKTKSNYKGSLIIAPSAAQNSSWLKQFSPCVTAMVSGWMQLRGQKRRRNVDKGFVLSDHADWIGLNKAIEATNAENIYITHGYKNIFTRWLRQKGYNAHILETYFNDEFEEQSQQ